MNEKRLRGVHGQTVEALADRILAGGIGEGDTLDLPALREELDVSLTALREALKVLSAKGIIDARQKRGTFVRPRSSWNLLDTDVMRWQTRVSSDHGLLDELTEMRVIVEPAAARLAAERASDADIEVLDAALDRMASARDLAATVRADLDFHRLLVAAAHNTFLTQVERIIAIGLAERDELVHGTADDPVPSHRAVLDAVAGRDPEAAYLAMRAMVDKSGAES